MWTILNVKNLYKKIYGTTFTEHKLDGKKNNTNKDDIIEYDIKYELWLWHL